MWVNRDVIGPEDGERLVDMKVTDEPCFRRFATDYRKAEGEQIEFTELGEQTFRLRLADAWEFATKKDYLENWQSEMHERFCFWSESDWRQELENVGFRLSPESTTYLNPWIEENRLQGQIELTEPDSGNPIAYPPTTTVMVAEKF